MLRGKHYVYLEKRGFMGKGSSSRVHYAWLVLAGCCCLQAGGLGVMLNSAGVFFSPVCVELGFTQGGISAYLTFYSWSTCVGMLLVARFFPRLDTRVLMSACAIFVILALGLMSIYDELWQWYASGVVFGLAGSFLFVVPAPILIGNWFYCRAGLATGVAMAFSGIGAAAFSPLFTLLIGQIGWRATYVVAAAIAAVLILPWTLFVFRFSPEKMGLKPYGWVGERPGADQDAGSPLRQGATLRQALPTAAFALLFLFAGMSSCYGAYNSQLPNFALTAGMSALFGAGLVSFSQMGNIFSKVVMGWLTDRLGIYITVILQLALVAASMVIFMLAPSAEALCVAAFLFGFQNNLVSASTPLLIKSVFGIRSYTEIFSFVRLGTGIIGGIGITAVALSYDAFGTYEIAFAGGCLLALLSIACVVGVFLARKKACWG